MVNTNTTTDETEIYFDGSNWEDLIRLEAIARFQFLQDSDYNDNAPGRCAYLSSRFRGDALDWVATRYSLEPSIFENFPLFVAGVKEAFGIQNTNLVALRRTDLENLKWDADAPTFFANFDRLTMQLGMVAHETRITLLGPKLPHSVRKKLAEQALNFANYDTMRERILTMWALDPDREPVAKPKKPRCGKCGKKGHVAAECKAKN
jgi:hypothetical protein